MSCRSSASEEDVYILEDYVLLNNQLVPKAAISDAFDNSENMYAVEEESGEGEEINIQENNEDSKFLWDNKTTLLFLDEYHKRIDAFRNPKVKKRTLWDSIANATAEKGYQVDGATLDRKMRNMKSTFNKIKDNNKKKKTGRGRIHWEYYEKFCAIFVEDKTVNTTNIVASLAMQDSARSSPEPDAIKNSSDQETPSNSREKQSRLDLFRKRQLHVEEQRLEELKKIRLAIEESNKINYEKLNIFKQYLNKE